MTDEVSHALSLHPSILHIYLYGIEAHVCVLQTALDLLRQGYTVYLIADAISSQTQADREYALQVRARGRVGPCDVMRCGVTRYDVM